MSRSVSRTVAVAAPPEAIFELLARPERHAELDGSGTVRGSTRAGRRLGLGSRFGMRMRVRLPYRIVNEVIEFGEGRLIAWRHWFRHVWRWELAPVEGGTEVTETFDWEPSLLPLGIEVIRAPERNTRSIEATLARLVERFGAVETDPAADH